ncbi:MAG: DUF192 domain-containing protein [Candidatus Taylorbacteria bacterium]|nr:DUF192 domain-containing protein [Candidatus Taylorbacteria bacterium]
MKFKAVVLVLAIIAIIVVMTYALTVMNSNNIDVSSDQALSTIGTVKINDSEIRVEVAMTGAETARGLGGRSSLLEGKGMWFVFPKPELYGFWMKDMNFPIDIIWFDENANIVAIRSNVRPETYPEVFYPSVKALYVLEVPAHFAEKHGFNIGDSAEIHPQAPK